MSNPVGRPSEYTPEAINVLNEYLQFAIPENMKIPTVEGLALKLGINKTTLYRWAENNEEFRNALDELKMRQKESLTDIGIFGGKEINATIVGLLLKVNHDMIEKTAVENTIIMPKPLLNELDVHNNHSSQEAETTQ